MKLPCLQLALCLLACVPVYMIFGKLTAQSVLLGGLVALIPNFLFARKLFQHQGARAARQIVRNFYAGEFIKILSTALLFTVVFLFCEVSPPAFFLTYIVMIMTHWFAPLIIDMKQNGPESD